METPSNRQRSARGRSAWRSRARGVVLDPQQRRDIVVVGASAGGVEALRELVSALPGDLPASVLVALHTPAASSGTLAEVLARAGKLPAGYPRDGDDVVHGRVVVAPPDQHLVVDGSRLRLVRGPRENGVRPAIDPLFRTAAHSYGPRVMGVLLSGALDDGTAGLVEIERAGGVTVVQDPEEALVPSMPLSAMRAVDVHYVAPVQRIAKLIAQLAEVDPSREMHDEPTAVAEPSDAESLQGVETQPPAAFICPECGGALADASDGSVVRYACHVGHVYSAGSMLSQHEQALERALWTALRTLTESAALRREMAARATRIGLGGLEEAYLTQAAELERRADVIRSVVERDTPGQADALRAAQEAASAEDVS